MSFLLFIILIIVIVTASNNNKNTQNNNAQKVLDGDIDMFINDNLRMCKNEK